MKRYVRSASVKFTYNNYLEACDETARWIESNFPQLRVVRVESVPEEGDPFYGAPPRCGFKLRHGRNMLKNKVGSTYFSVDDVFDPAGCTNDLQLWLAEADEATTKAELL